MDFLEQQRIPTKVCRKKARNAEMNTILYQGRLKTPISLNIQYNLPKFPRIAYSFTTGSQLHLDSYSTFKYLIPHPDHGTTRADAGSTTAPQTPPQLTPGTPGASSSPPWSSCSGSTLSTGGLLFLLFLQVSRPFYSFYRWVALSTLSTQDLLRVNCPHCAQIASSR